VKNMKKSLLSIVLILIAGLLVQAGFANPKSTIVTVAFEVPTVKIKGMADQIRALLDNTLNQLGTVTLVDKSAYDAEVVKNGQTVDAAKSDFIGALAGKINCARYVCYVDVTEAVVTRIYKDKIIETKNKNTGVVTRTTRKIWYWEGKLKVTFKIYDTKTGMLVYNQPREMINPYEEDWSAPPMDPMTGLPMIPDFNILRPDLVTSSVNSVIGDSLWTDIYNLFRPSGKIVDIKPVDEKGKSFTVTIDIGQDVGVKDWEKYSALMIDPALLPLLTAPQKSQVVANFKIKMVLANQAQAVVNKKDADKLKAGMDVKAKIRPYGGVTGVNALFY